MIQANTATGAMVDSLGVNNFFVGFLLAFLTGLVIIGGIHRIAEVASFLFP